MFLQTLSKKLYPLEYSFINQHHTHIYKIFPSHMLDIMIPSTGSITAEDGKNVHANNRWRRASVIYTSNKLKKKERDWLGVPETNNKWRAFVIL